MSNSKLYVGNLSFNTTEGELRSHFEQFGSVTDTYVAMDKMTGRPRGFAFVTMGTADEAKLAIEKTNGVELGGRALQVNEARPKEERPGGGFEGGAVVGGLLGSTIGGGRGSDIAAAGGAHQRRRVIEERVVLRVHVELHADAVEREEEQGAVGHVAHATAAGRHRAE